MTGSLDGDVNGQPVRFEFRDDPGGRGSLEVIFPSVRTAARSLRAFRAADRMTTGLQRALIGWYEPAVSLRMGNLPRIRVR